MLSTHFEFLICAHCLVIDSQFSCTSGCLLLSTSCITQDKHLCRHAS